MDILVDIFNGHFQIAPNDLKDDDDVERALQKKKANAVERALKGLLSGSCPNLSLLVSNGTNCTLPLLSWRS